MILHDFPFSYQDLPWARSDKNNTGQVVLNMYVNILHNFKKYSVIAISIHFYLS